MIEPPEPKGTEQSKDAPLLPLSLENAVAIIRLAMRHGRVHETDHFRFRCNERGFNDVDAGRIIRFGRLRGKPKFSEEYGNWCFKFEGTCEGRLVEVRLALDPNEDFEDPLVILITVIAKGRTNDVTQSAEI